MTTAVLLRMTVALLRMTKVHRSFALLRMTTAEGMTAAEGMTMAERMGISR
jgi:hypothetical protein